MSKKARKSAIAVSPAVAEKIKELAELIATERFGSQGVPKDITFSEIEEIGHQAGRTVAAEVDRSLVAGHADQLGHEQVCPQCGEPCSGQSHRRELLTRDGPVELVETACFCAACRRSFFPSARSIET